MLLLDYFRGQDSTGFVSVSKGGRVETLKIAEDPIMLFQHQDFEQTLVGNADSIWIGHNRAATIGATTRMNAHPFTCGHITGVHNGTLLKESFTAIADRLDETYGTDSETIFAHIAQYGVEDTIPRLQGAWALVWYDEQAKTLNMVKNDQRPLWTCESERNGGRVLTWASEYQMIYAARVMAGEKEELVTDKDGFAYFPLPNDTLHVWKHEDIIKGDTTPTILPLAGKPTPPKPAVGFTQSNVTNFKPKEVKKDEIEETEIIVEEEQEGRVLGGLLGEDEWNDMASYGCCYCGSDVHSTDEGLLICVEESIVLCKSCSGEPVTKIVDSINILNVVNAN